MVSELSRDDFRATNGERRDYCWVDSRLRSMNPPSVQWESKWVQIWWDRQKYQVDQRSHAIRPRICFRMKWKHTILIIYLWLIDIQIIPSVRDGRSWIDVCISFHSFDSLRVERSIQFGFDLGRVVTPSITRRILRFSFVSNVVNYTRTVVMRWNDVGKSALVRRGFMLFRLFGCRSTSISSLVLIRWRSVSVRIFYSEV